jgi:hypothetical protein
MRGRTSATLRKGTAFVARSSERKALTALTALLIAVALFVGGAAAWQSWTSHNSHTSVPAVEGLKPGVPAIVSLSQLEDLAAEQGPLYWAGPRNGTHYEVTVTTDGGTYVRYVPIGAQAGAKTPYLTVGTYRAVNGYGALSKAKKTDADVVVARSGAVIATFHAAPASTYFAFPDAAFQVEVFAPLPGESRKLTESGAIRLVPGTR